VTNCGGCGGRGDGIGDEPAADRIRGPGLEEAQPGGQPLPDLNITVHRMPCQPLKPANLPALTLVFGVPSGANRAPPLDSSPMHGTLSAAVIILAYAVVAIAAGYAAVKVIRGGPHGE
jgi:hypothetical protein